MEQSLKNKGWEQMRNILDKEMPVIPGSSLPISLKVTVLGGCILLILAGIILQPQPWEKHPEDSPKIAIEFSAEPAEMTERSEPAFISNTELDKTKNTSHPNTIESNEDAAPIQRTEVKISTDDPGALEIIAATHFSPSDIENEKLEANTETHSLDQIYSPELDIENNFSVREVVTPKSITSSNPEKNRFLSSSYPSLLNLNDIKIEQSKIMAISNSIPEKTHNSYSPCESSWALGLHYKNNGQHNLHGLGLVAMRSNDLNSRWFVSYGAELTHFIFKRSGSLEDFNFLSEWDSSLPASQSNEFLFRKKPKHLIQAYWKAGISLNVGYYLFPNLKVFSGFRVSHVFEARTTTFLESFDSSANTEETQFSYRLSNLSENLVNPFHLTAGLGIAYEFNCRFSAGIDYHRQLTHFWQSDVFRDRSKKGNFTLRLMTHF